MAMLDKEMAEERAEVAEADLEEVRERLAMVEVESLSLWVSLLVAWDISDHSGSEEGLGS